MSTITRPELSKRNKYYVEKHRYYELKHFCLQYPLWKKTYESLNGLSKRPLDLMIFAKTNSISNPTEKNAIAMEYYSNRIKMIEQVCEETDEVIGSYILKAVTEGISYDTLRTNYGIPCCKDIYYDLYRRFFWLLNKVRE